MPRLTITLPCTVYNKISLLASECEDSMSGIINRLVRVGMHCRENDPQLPDPIAQHCYHLIIQMNALVKNISSEVLNLTQQDFEKLKMAAHEKLEELKKKTD